MKPLPSLRAGLLRQRLDNELLVYDAQDDQIHLLNASTAEVVELMDRGETAEAIAEKLSDGKGPEAGAEMLALALDQLAIARLIDNSPKTAADAIMGPATRRQAVQRIVGFGAALVIPAVITLTPGKAGAQAQTLTQNGGTCQHNAQCASGCCGGTSKAPCQSNICSIPADCSGNGQSCTA